jgi:hypothetical protein
VDLVQGLHSSMINHTAGLAQLLALLTLPPSHCPHQAVRVAGCAAVLCLLISISSTLTNTRPSQRSGSQSESCYVCWCLTFIQSTMLLTAVCAHCHMQALLFQCLSSRGSQGGLCAHGVQLDVRADNHREG